jgi:hypothetical protein
MGDAVDPRLVSDTRLDLPLDAESLIEGVLYDGVGTGPAVAQVLWTERRAARHEHKKNGRVHIDTAACARY